MIKNLEDRIKPVVEQITNDLTVDEANFSSIALQREIMESIVGCGDARKSFKLTPRAKTLFFTCYGYAVYDLPPKAIKDLISEDLFLCDKNIPRHHKKKYKQQIFDSLQECSKEYKLFLNKNALKITEDAVLKMAERSYESSLLDTDISSNCKLTDKIKFSSSLTKLVEDKEKYQGISFFTINLDAFRHLSKICLYFKFRSNSRDNILEFYLVVVTEMRGRQKKVVKLPEFISNKLNSHQKKSRSFVTKVLSALRICLRMARIEFKIKEEYLIAVKVSKRKNKKETNH